MAAPEGTWHCTNIGEEWKQTYDKAKLIYKICFIFFTKKAEAVDPELDKKEGLPAVYFKEPEVSVIKY